MHPEITRRNAQVGGCRWTLAPFDTAHVRSWTRYSRNATLVALGHVRERRTREVLPDPGRDAQKQVAEYAAIKGAR